ncbi:MAG: hypothetical protein IJ760_08535 [Bacteroidales bacterium]|nr:hypothetical protein [Bacteroidales bacterium]
MPSTIWMIVLPFIAVGVVFSVFFLSTTSVQQPVRCRILLSDKHKLQANGCTSRCTIGCKDTFFFSHRTGFSYNLTFQIPRTVTHPVICTRHFLSARLLCRIKTQAAARQERPPRRPPSQPANSQRKAALGQCKGRLFFDCSPIVLRLFFDLASENNRRTIVHQSKNNQSLHTGIGAPCRISKEIHDGKARSLPAGDFLRSEAQ